MNALLSADSVVGEVFGKPRTLGEIARWDKNLAYVFAQMGTVGQQQVTTLEFTGGWELINVAATWSSGAANQNVPGAVDGLVETDLWINSVKYTVQRPNAFAGSIFKAQSDEMNKLNPNINAQLIINSYCRYLISTDYTPLENMTEQFSCSCPAGIVLSCSGNIQASFTNLRALTADEIPTIATITLSGTRLPRGLYNSCGYGELLAFLTKAQILPGAPCP